MKTHHLQYDCDGMTVNQTIVVKEIRVPVVESSTPDPNEITITPAETAALKRWAKRWKIECSNPSDCRLLFFASALVFQEALYPAMEKYLQYCADEDVVPDVEGLRKIMVSKFSKAK